MKKLLLVAALFCGVYSAQAIKIIYRYFEGMYFVI